MQNSAKIKLIIAMTIFGTIGLVRIFIPFSSSFIALCRGAIGTAFLFLVHFIKREKFDLASIKKNMIKLFCSGALIGVNWIFLFESYQYTGVSVATICYYMAPVFVILASPFVLGEKMTVKKAACSFFALVGMVFVSGVIETGISGIVGIAFGLGAALMYAAVVLLNKKMIGLTAFERTIFQLLFATMVLLPYVLCTENVISLKFTPQIIALLLTAGIVHTGVAYTLYFGSIKIVSAQTASLFSYIDPVVAIVTATMFLNDAMSILAWIGVILVIGSTAVSELNLFKNNKLQKKEKSS